MIHFRLIPLSRLLLFAGLLSSPGVFAQRPPNIVLLLADDLGWTDLRCYGSTFYETPAIDALAAGGMKFTNAYSACTVCSPSRASILTGKSPARLHITDWITGYQLPYARLSPPEWTQYLPLEETTIAEVLKSRGYRTASIGKWHLGDDVKYYPEHQGFDVNIAGTYVGAPPSYFSPYRISRLKNGPEGEYLTDRLASEAENFIESAKDKPFFLYFPFYAVHTPLKARAADEQHFRQTLDSGSAQRNPVYAGVIKAMDDGVGRIVAKLRALNLLENTLIVFTSDNGGLLSNGKITSNLPLRAGKGTAYEGGTRVPAIFYWKNRIRAGAVNATPVIGTDLFATFSAASGSRTPVPPDGQNLVPLLTGTGTLSRDALYWHYPHYHSEGGTPYSAIRKNDWRLVYFYESGKKELYNLATDPGEKTDRSGTSPQLTASLFAMLQTWLKESGAQSPLPNPAYDEPRARQKKNGGEERNVPDPGDLNK